MKYLFWDNKNYHFCAYKSGSAEISGKTIWFQWSQGLVTPFKCQITIAGISSVPYWIINNILYFYSKITSCLSFRGGGKRNSAGWMKSDMVSLSTGWESQAWNDRVRTAETILVWHERGETKMRDMEDIEMSEWINDLDFSWNKSEKMQQIQWNLLWFTPGPQTFQGLSDLYHTVVLLKFIPSLIICCIWHL